jgi:hypothetical protein
VCWRRLSPRQLGAQVGRVAFKRRATPLEGDHVFALPYASCLSTFQAPGWGIPPVFPPHRWSNATPRELVPFSHRSASRIFISQPGCTPPPPPPAGPQDGGPPTLSFKDVHHPRWGGGRAEPELYLPRGFVGHPLLRCSRERALAGPAGGSDFDNAGLVDGGRRQPSVSSSSAWLPVAPPAGRRLPLRVHGRTAQDVARC